MIALPPFPTDDATLDLLWTAMHPGPDAERTSVGDLLTLYSQMAGSDTDAVAEELGENVRMMRDPCYHEHDVLIALITEVRRLRAAASPRGILAAIKAADENPRGTYRAVGGTEWTTVGDKMWEGITSNGRTVWAFGDQPGPPARIQPIVPLVITCPTCGAAALVQCWERGQYPDTTVWLACDHVIEGRQGTALLEQAQSRQHIRPLEPGTWAELTAANPPMLIPPALDRLRGLPDASATFTGWFDTDSAAYRNMILPKDGARVFLSLPDGRWQRFKAMHADAWWMRWLVRLRPVRYAEAKTFVGQMRFDDDGSVTVTQLDTGVT